MLAALSAGGHLRVGMEDTVTYAKGGPVRDNAQLVARAAGFARLAQRPPLTTADGPAPAGHPDPWRPHHDPEARSGRRGSRRRAARARLSSTGAMHAPMAEVRQLRRRAEQEEVNLSYTRRLLQGRLDIVRRELQRRAENDGRSLVDLLPEILAEKGRGPAHGLGRHQTVSPAAPEEYESWVNALTPSVDLSAISGLHRRRARAGRAGTRRCGDGPVRAPPRCAAGDGRAGRGARPPLPRRRGRRRGAAGRRGPVKAG